MLLKGAVRGPLLSGHPLLNGHFSNSQKSVPLYLFAVNLTSSKRSPLLSVRGHHLEFPID